MAAVNYSFSHATSIKWALEMELNSLIAAKSNDINIIDYLKNRINELKEFEKECLKIQAS